jgi:hypothetical protein
MSKAGELTERDVERILIVIARLRRVNTKKPIEAKDFDVDKFLRNFITNHRYAAKRQAVTDFVQDYFEKMKIYDKLISEV